MNIRRWARSLLADVLPALLLAVCLLPARGQSRPAAPQLSVIHVDHGANSAAAEKAHYVVLVSLDGFRWDYAERDGAKHLLALGREGVWAPEGMLPSFPSLTFPNHYAIVTGLYPEHNGLVANRFMNPATGKRYAINDPKAVLDGAWYNGVPLWSLAESQGMRSACFFWPGSEAKIAGFLPTYYLHYSEQIDDNARIDQVIAWLGLPAAERPHFITLYFSEPDHEGHEYGPDAPETRAAVQKVDGLVGKLESKLDATGLPVDLIVVSDHGMAKTEDGWMTLDKLADLSGFETDGPLLYAKNEADRVRVYNELKKASSKFKVYRRARVPADLHYDQNASEGDPVVVATGPYAIRAHGPPAGAADRAPIAGMHGFDPHMMPEMKASFFAAGPDILPGNTVLPFENVNLYPWIAHMLGLTPARNDGKLNILAGTLRDGGGKPQRKREH